MSFSPEYSSYCAYIFGMDRHVENLEKKLDNYNNPFHAGRKSMVNFGPQTKKF